VINTNAGIIKSLKVSTGSDEMFQIEIMEIEFKIAFFEHASKQMSKQRTYQQYFLALTLADLGFERLYLRRNEELFKGLLGCIPL